MADTKTAERTAQAVPPIAPEAKPPATISKREAWEGFRDELEKRASEIGSQLPSMITRDRFLNAAIAAVKATPDILLATPRSLFSALTKAASDGLLPDGREGIITVYQQKVKDSQPERREWVAQWNPMFYGIRKRAREIDDIIIDAQVVFEGDEFDYELGDHPFIKHKPKMRTKNVDASAGLAVYAIFRAQDDRILHREVMFKPEVFDVMNQSRAKGSLMWTTFWTEGWRKTCGRRGSKSVPISPKLEQIIQRDDENFSFDRVPQAIEPPKPPEPPLHNLPLPEGAKNEGPADDFNADDSGVPTEPETRAEFVGRLKYWLDLANSADEVEQTWSELDVGSELDGHDAERAQADALKADALARFHVKHEQLSLDDMPEATRQAVKNARTP